MSRKTVIVCDQCGSQVDDKTGAAMRLQFTDARRGAKAADLCDTCAGKLPGHPAARRGRRPAVSAAT